MGTPQFSLWALLGASPSPRISPFLTFLITSGLMGSWRGMFSPSLFKSAMEVMIATEMSEGTLENIAAVFGQSASTIGAVTGSTTTTRQELGLAAGALGEAPTERQLIAIGQAPTATNTASERIYYARRVLSVQQSQFSLARTTPTTFPVTFRLLPDANQAGTEYGKIIDRVLTV